MPDLLLEIGCEEIPARLIDAASRELREKLTALLQRERLEPAGAISHFDTPRRLAVLAVAFPPPNPISLSGSMDPPPRLLIKMASPRRRRMPCQEGWRRCWQPGEGHTPKGDYLAATVTRKGRTVAEILPSCCPRNFLTLLAEEYVLA